MLIISRTVMQHLETLIAHGTPDFKSGRGSIFISKEVPAAYVRLSYSREELFRSLMAIPDFKTFKIQPVSDNPSDIIILGTVSLEGNMIAIDGKSIDIL